MIYIIYKDGCILYPTTLPRIVLDAFKSGADRVELWNNGKLVKSTASVREFMNIINPQPTEDDDNGGAGYEW